jgi:hypothetical protein
MGSLTMGCLIPLVAGACLLDPSHVMLRMESNWQVSHQNYYKMDDRPYNGGLGRLEIMGGGNLSRSLRFYYGVGHQSYLDTNRDAGYEYLFSGFEWHPFR